MMVLCEVLNHVKVQYSIISNFSMSSRLSGSLGNLDFYLTAVRGHELLVNENKIIREGIKPYAEIPQWAASWLRKNVLREGHWYSG